MQYAEIVIDVQKTLLELWQRQNNCSPEAAIREFTRGGCYLFAVGAGRLLQEKGIPVRFVDNGEHVYLIVGDKYFDAVHYSSEPVGLMTADFREMDFETCWAENLLDDELGYNLLLPLLKDLEPERLAGLRERCGI